ncbi:MAG: catalase [Candidatus Dormibacteraeota bacterium]|uniref:catalase n=1 Tax=Candidatus Amunia macphersoniae TaxID=3127014 RepID=A0A934KJP3_9BACT|nr:catalase [Candidatus Dormibacteraeota bacterium]
MSESRRTLTTRQGHPVSNNQSERTIGPRGPATLENYQFLEKISHFDRERIPERVVHARGTVAHGFFEAYGKIGDEPASKYTRAKLFAEKGKRTPLSIRFSTVAGGRDSSEVARDPRGFAVKFRTEDGNWDLVGNNLPVFFIRDAIKFPDFIHSQKPDPVSFYRQDPNRVFDFIAATPEALHMIMFVFSPRGIPSNYRHQQGFGVNTYRMVNAAGDSVLVKYHWHPKQGVESMTATQAAFVQGTELGSATLDLRAAIERGDHPQWEMLVQIISDDEHPELDFDPLDDTKVWPEDQFPLRPVGRMVLDRAIVDNFTENEQIAFGTGVLVDGLEFSDDKMLVGRTFSYSDTQRYRVGTNYLQLAINHPAEGVEVNTNQRDGQMAYGVDGHTDPHVNYEPSLTGGLAEAEQHGGGDVGPVISGRLTRAQIPRQNDYQQAADRWQTIEQWERDDLVANLSDALGQCTRMIQERMVWHLLLIDDELGTAVADAVEVSLDAVRKLEPLSTQELTAEDHRRLGELGKAGPRPLTTRAVTGSVPNSRAEVPELTATDAREKAGRR